MNIEDEKIFTILNCGVEYEMPWEYLKRCDFFENLRQENKIPESNIFKLFTSPVAFPYVLSYLINPSTSVPIEYKLDFAYFGIEPKFKNDVVLFDKLKDELLYETKEKLLDELECRLKNKIRKNCKLLKELKESLGSLKEESMDYYYKPTCRCGSTNIKPGSGGYCYACD